MNKYILTITFVIITTFILLMFDNKSNFPTGIMIPLIVAGLTKYIIGDWDTKFQWSYSDIIYWFLIFTFSYGTIIFRKRFI